MSSLGFSYLPRLVIDVSTNRKEEVFTPYVPIMVSYGHGNPTRPIDALVDSDSDRNLFPLQLGQMVGINFKKIKAKPIFGIGGIQLKAYTSKINIWVNNKKYFADLRLVISDFGLRKSGWGGSNTHLIKSVKIL